jgi:radical SAM superfamily enzyme YgiQ (UPF0313 family)
MPKHDLTKERFLFPRQSGGELVVLNCFPNTYNVGMASLGYQSVFKIFASHPKTHTFRYFTDFHEIHPKEVHLITFSISWELDFFNLLEIFKQLNIPFKASERNPEHPLVLGGGPVLTANPEPWAEFFDLIAIGDCEDNMQEVISESNKFIDWISTSPSAPRNDRLQSFSKIPGIYVTSLKQESVARAKSKAEQLLYSSVIAPDSAWDDVGLLEVARSCPEMCRFCLASYLTLPFRAPSFENNLIQKVEHLLEHTSNLGLLGASVTQHPEFMELLFYLKTKKNKIPELKVQIASVRASTVTKELCEALVELGTKSLTIAIESGSQRLRDIINKKLPEEYIFSACKYALEAGMKQVKLYGMVGLPHETDEDIDATIDLLIRLNAENKALKIIWGCSIFTPKAQTPFQDYGVDKDAERKLKKLIKALKPKGIEVREESFKWAQVQALISRGDRSINNVLVRAYESGQRGFGVYKKLMSPEDYKHFVFDTWDSSQLGFKYPWQILVSEKQAKILNEHKEDAFSKSIC